MIFTIALSTTIFAVVCIGISLDRCWIRLTPLTPLSVVLFGIFTRSVCAPLLMSLGDTFSLEEKAIVMIEFRNEVQALWLLFAIFLVLPYALRRKTTEKIRGRKDFVINVNAIAVFILATGLFSLVWIYIGLISGSASRDPELYAAWVNKFWKPDALFTAFGRLRDCFYFLAPLGLFKIRRYWIKAMILSIVAMNLYAALQLGGRGIVLLPILEMYFGIYLLGLGKKVLGISTCFMLILGLSGSQLLRGAHSFNINDPGIFIRAGESLVKRSDLVRTGLSLYGCSDAYNFTVDNIKKPGAGWVRSNRWLTAWMPSSLKGSAKGSSRDAHIIAEQLENGSPQRVAEAKNYYSFNCVTFPGDLFWRWRWMGVIFGALVFGQLYYFFARFWRKLIGLDSLSGCLAFCFPASFLSLYPAGSLGETFWLWTWDIQKYLLLYFVLRFVEAKRIITFNET